MKSNLIIFLDFMRRLYKTRSMLWSMSLRNLKVRYVGSLFGLLWAIINPLTQVAIYGIVFGVFLKGKADPSYGTNNYFLFLVCGLIPWQFFSQAVLSATTVIVSNTSLIRKSVGFPSEILPITTVTTHVISHLISMGLLVAILMILGQSLTPYVVLVFLYMLLIFIFAIGLGWILSSMYVYLRDVQQVVNLVMMAWLFLTPIFYSERIIPHVVLPVLRLNPMFQIVDGYRFALLKGAFIPFHDFITVSITCFATFAVGGVFFRRLKSGFAEIL